MKLERLFGRENGTRRRIAFAVDFCFSQLKPHVVAQRDPLAADYSDGDIPGASMRPHCRREIQALADLVLCVFFAHDWASLGVNPVSQDPIFLTAKPPTVQRRFFSMPCFSTVYLASFSK